MRPEAVPGLRRLTDAIHAEGAAISAQIGHAGPVADARSNKAKALAPVRFFNPIGMRFAKKATRDDIDDVIARARQRGPARRSTPASTPSRSISATTTWPAAFLSPLINRRDDEFGGSLENRAKVARGMVMAVRRAVDKEGTPIAVTAKLNMADGVRGGISHRRVAADREMARGGRRAGRDRTHRGQLAGQPDVPVPRRRAGQGVRRRLQAARCAGASA